MRLGQGAPAMWLGVDMAGSRWRPMDLGTWTWRGTDAAGLGMVEGKCKARLATAAPVTDMTGADAR
jgi:hypothetical protein